MIEKKFLQIVLFGDSMSWSPGVPIGERYADFLEENLKEILNENYCIDVAACGDGGNTAAEGFERLQRDCLSYQAHIVVLSFGANDSIRAPDREQFKTYYKKIINSIRQNLTRYIILETVPAVDQEWHSQRDNPKAVFYGGLEKYIEFFSHSFIREIAKLENLILYDRFNIYHQEISKNPELREQWLQKDGIHLTGAGNKFFAQRLASIISPLVPEIPQVQINSERWLEEARLNPVYIECYRALVNNNLKEYLTQSQNLKRLMLQKARSFSRRAKAYADKENLRIEAEILECLSSGFMAAEKILNTQDTTIKEKSKKWAESYLKKIPDNTAAKKLLEFLTKYQ